MLQISIDISIGIGPMFKTEQEMSPGPLTGAVYSVVAAAEAVANKPTAIAVSIERITSSPSGQLSPGPAATGCAGRLSLASGRPRSGVGPGPRPRSTARPLAR